MASTHKEGSGRLPKTERFDARITREQKKLFARAAALKGRSVTEFVIASAYEAATATVGAERQLLLNDRDSKAFVEALVHAKSPTRRLKEAVRRYKKRR